MALWDSLTKKASETTAKAVQQAKILAETTKLNSQIADEEKKISNNYYQIGKLYAAMHQNDCEEDFAGMLAEIAEAEQKIRELKIQIQDIKGVVRCESCGAEVSKESAFCSACGAALPKVEVVVEDPDHEKCDSCGALVEKGMRFCTACGKPLAAQPAAEAEVVEEAAPCEDCAEEEKGE